MGAHDLPAASRRNRRLHRPESVLKTLRTAIGDYLAGSYKFPLAAGLGAGAAGLYAVIEFFPGFMKEYDPGMGMLIVLGAPLIAVAAALVVWQRRWRARRAAEHTAAAGEQEPAASLRGRFSGLPDPGASKPASAGLPAAAKAALDRNDPIAAIKVLRAERKLGLAEAKALVDAELARRKGGS
jgi:ribosomal protein L7/L12